MTASKKKGSKLKYFVGFSIGMCILFTIVMIIVFCLFETIPDTLCTCFYATFGGECLSCALIKVFNLRSKNNDE